MVRIVLNISVESDLWLRQKARRKGDLSRIVDKAILAYKDAQEVKK